MSRLSAVGLAVASGALTLTFVSSAAACSFAAPQDYDPILDPFNAAEIAVTGRVSRVRYEDPTPREPNRPPDYGQTQFIATVRIARVYKGKTGPALRIKGSTEESTCGFGEVRVGEEVALLLGGGRSPFRVALGDRTSQHDLGAATGGRYHRPGTR